MSETVEGDSPQQQFGFSVTISGSVLPVGSPGHSPSASILQGRLDAFDFPDVGEGGGFSGTTVLVMLKFC